MKYEIKQLNNTDAVVISDKETRTLLAKDLSCVVKITDVSKRVYFTTENMLTGEVGFSYHHEREEKWYNVLATISPFKIEGLPMLELPKIEITGYRLKPNIEKGMVDRVLNYAMPNWDDNDKSVYFIRGHVGGSLVAKLKELGVLNLWFTPIYDEDIKTWCKEHHYNCYYKEGLMAELPNPFKEEDIVDELAKKYAEENAKDENISYHNLYAPLEYAFRAGYNAAQKQYSEEDMKNCFLAAREFNSQDGVVDIDVILPMGGNMSDLSAVYITADEYLQSLQKKQFPIAVELTEDLQIIKWYY